MVNQELQPRLQMKSLQLSLFLLLILYPPSCNRRNQKQDSAQTLTAPNTLSTVSSIIETSLKDPDSLLNIPFSTVISASSGKEIIPVDPHLPADAELLTALNVALDNTLELFNRPDSPALSVKRINEVSFLFEKKLQSEINSTDGFLCSPPLTASGKLQRSGYPDLRIVHQETGRITYLDPKLIGPKLLNSSLRTFYFTPRSETGKILDDAHHLLVGIEHDGNTGKWKFTDWHLVDLSSLKVRFKPEFQANNKNIYRDELFLIKNKPQESP